jgi:hypothetical protein
VYPYCVALARSVVCVECCVAAAVTWRLFADAPDDTVRTCPERLPVADL